MGPEYILNLDIFEARHQLDNLVCYSGLKDTTFYDLQKGLAMRPTLQIHQNANQSANQNIGNNVREPRPELQYSQEQNE